MIDYKKRLVEVDEILNYLSNEEYNKIPDEIKQLIKANKDKEYTWYYDETKPLKEQNLTRDTIVILSYINMEYLLSTEQKQLMIELHKINEKNKNKKENDVIIENHLENMFKQNEIVMKPNKVERKVELVEEKSENFFNKLLKKIKSIIYKG